MRSSFNSRKEGDILHVENEEINVVVKYKNNLGVFNLYLNSEGILVRDFIPLATE